MTYEEVQHRKSAIHGPPITLPMLRVKSDKSDCLSHCLTVRNILVPKGRSPFGQHQESRPLGATMLKYKGINRILLTWFHCAVCIYCACLKWLLPESLVFRPLVKGNEDSGNEIECEMNSLRMLRKSDPGRGRD